MHIFHKMTSALQNRKYAEALPMIEELTRRHPNVATNWYNYGDCLEKLERHEEAASAFLRAVDVDPSDGGAYYRACLALVAGKDTARLLSVFRRICEVDPSMMVELRQEPEFAPYFQLPEFDHLYREFAGG